jgi:signal peptide peptidase SppA
MNEFSVPAEQMQVLETRTFAPSIKYARILREVCGALWAIQPMRLSDIVDVLAYQAAGGKLSMDEIREYVGMQAARPERVMQAGQGVAVIGLRGIISHRIEQVQDISGPGGTSVEGFRTRLRDALASTQVGAIVLDVDSPGGNVDGVPEMAAELFAARGEKPIVAVANTTAASGAYYIASQADEVVITPSGDVGSIGVFSAHEDMSAALEQEGIKMTLIHAGKYKVEGNPFEPLSDEGREAVQGRVDAVYDEFIDAVARGRGVKASAVRNGFGQGRSVGAREAVTMSMADSVETLDQVIQRLQGRSGNRPKRRMGPVSASHFEFYPAA